MAKYCRKFPLTMKLFIMFMLYSVVGTYAAAYSQEAKLNLGVQNCTVSELLSALGKQTGYNFFFNNSHIDVNRRVAVNTNGKDVFAILDNVFAGTNVVYSVKNKRIIFSVKEEQAVKQVSTHLVSGIITDELGEPVIGASVIEKGTTNGTITDLDGKFTLNLSSDKALIEVSYIGYSTQTIKYVPGHALKVTLKEDTQNLQEVVVVGFGSQKKANLTGSVSQVKMDDVLGNRPVTSVKNALQGTMPGLTVTGGSSPGESKTFNIRGTTSINGVNPLVLIDNVEGSIDLLNPEDIESISVLKDAASSAIYGARAAGGVILVTTKKAKKGERFKLNYNNNFGFQSSINQPEQASLDSYLKALQDADFPDEYTVTGGSSVAKWREYLAAYKQDPFAFKTVGDGIYVGEDGKNYYLNEKNLYDQFLETSFMQTHNISATGGTEKLRYRIAGGLSKEDGPLVESKDTYMRKNISTFLGADITDWFTQEIDMRYSVADRTTPNSVGTGLWNTNIVSYYPQGVMPGSVNTGSDEDLPICTPANILRYQNATKTDTDNARIFLKSIFRPIKNLELVGEYTYDRRNVGSSYYANKWTYTGVEMSPGTSTGATDKLNNDYLTKSVTNYDYNALNLYGSYNFSLNKEHNFKVMAGFNQERRQTTSQSTTAYEMLSSTAPTFQSAQGKITASNSYDDYAIRGAFYRINYNYQDKYLIETNGRYDGSSKFPKNSRFGFFPSVSVGWNIARESWMKLTENWLGELKLRGSWGQIGNQNINNYQYYPAMTQNKGSVWLQDGDYVNYISAPSLISSSFTWEKVETLDFGIDASLFNNRLKATFDWYQRTTKGMLVAGIEMPAVIGTDAPMQNTADMRTKGWELSLTWRDKIGDWDYNIGVNLYDHTSKITKFNNEKGTLSFGGAGGTLASGCYYTGQTLGDIWGYVSDGYYTIDDFVDTSSWNLVDGVTSINGVNVRPGDEKFKNLNDQTGENEINSGTSLENPGDRKVIGNTTPRYCFGINLGVSYKGFSLSMMMQGTGKRDYWLGGASLFPFAGGTTPYRALYSNQTDYWEPQGSCDGLYSQTDREYWIAKNPDAGLYRIYDLTSSEKNVTSNTRISDKYLLNAAYLRIKNITLSYTFPQAMMKKISLSGLKLFVSGENLGTFSSLPKGYDPERLSWGYPFYRTVSFGLNVTL